MIRTQEINQLAEIANSQTHAAYQALFMASQADGPTYKGQSQIFTTCSNHFKMLFIKLEFIPALTGCSSCSKLTRRLLALPVRLGGLGISNPSETYNSSFQASEKMTTPLVEIILLQDQTKEVDDTEVAALKKDIIRDSNCQRSEQQATAVHSQLTSQLKCQVDLPKELGHPPGYLSCRYQTKGSTYIKENLEMPYAYAMDGPCQTHQGSATVVKHFQPITP